MLRSRDDMSKVFDKFVRFAIISDLQIYESYNVRPRAKCGVFALQKLTYVCALGLPGHVGVGRKHKRMQIWKSGLSSHSEETMYDTFTILRGLNTYICLP